MNGSASWSSDCQSQYKEKQEKPKHPCDQGFNKKKHDESSYSSHIPEAAAKKLPLPRKIAFHPHVEKTKTLTETATMSQNTIRMLTRPRDILSSIDSFYEITLKVRLGQ